MRKETRTLFNAYMARIAEINGIPVADASSRPWKPKCRSPATS